MPADHQIRVTRAPGAKCMTLDDVELFVQAMKVSGACPETPVRGRLTLGGWLTELTALSFPEDQDGNA